MQAMPAGSKRGVPPTTFVLKPQHADVPSAQLLFKMDGEGHMALLPNDYILKHLSTEAETFITRQVLGLDSMLNCTPAYTQQWSIKCPLP